MIDFLGELLALLAELFLEVVLELAGELVLDLMLRAASRLLGRVLDSEAAINAILASAGYGFVGVVAGYWTVQVFPHPLVHPSRFHGISLLVAPVATGLVMALVGSLLRRLGLRTTRIESFGYGFAFALGMALVRFLFAT